MPTHEEEAQFLRDFAALSEPRRARFLDALRKLVSDIKAEQPIRLGLRVKGVQGHPGVFEMTWAPDGRATFQYGTSPNAGDTHIIWRRVGSHEIFKQP
jgi:hypothetical protein